MLFATLTKTKDLIVWSWSYLWAFWFLLVAFVIFYLRGPLKISENLGMATMFLSTLTPKFYVALTGTSSLISGLILIFEWWYYRRYCCWIYSQNDPKMSIIIQVWNLIHRASVSEPHLAVAGWRRPPGGLAEPARGAGVQGVAEPSQPVPRRRVPEVPEVHQEGAAHLLRHEPLRPGPPNILHL